MDYTKLIGLLSEDAVKAAKEITNQASTTVEFPAAGVSVRCKLFRTEEALSIGVAPFIRDLPDDEKDAEQRAKELIELGRDVLCEISVEPKLVKGKATRKTEASIDDILDADITYGLGQVINLSRSRFYGMNHLAFDPMKEQGLFERQRKMGGIIDAMCARYGKLPHELRKMSQDDLLFNMAIFECQIDKKDGPDAGQ